MGDTLIRLNKASFRQIKRETRAVLPGVRHAHALEAVARGLGAADFNELRDIAREYGAILWCGDDAKAVCFLRARGASLRSGRLARLLEGHVMDHEGAPGFDEWLHGSTEAVDGRRQR